MRYFKHDLQICCLLAATAVAAWSHAIGQSLVDTLPPPYPSTGAPATTELNLGNSARGIPNSSIAPPLMSEGVVVSEAIKVDVKVEEEPKWYHPSFWLHPPEWDTAIELGVNGSSGTSNSVSVRSGGYIKRETELRKIDFDIYHNRTKASGVETQNNAQATFRHDWLMPNSRWTLYIQSQLYYDEFQAFDLNLNVDGGVGYRFLDEEWVELTGRVGSGTSREFGGLNDEWVPEAQFGLDYEQRVSATQKLTMSLDYFPEWDNYGEYRMLTDVGYEVELVVPSNVSLKIAATNRYDSDPQGANPNNLNYSVLLLWKL